MNTLPDPALLTWNEAHEHAAILARAAHSLRAIGGEGAARYLEGQSRRYTERANELAEAGD